MNSSKNPLLQRRFLSACNIFTNGTVTDIYSGKTAWFVRLCMRECRNNFVCPYISNVLQIVFDRKVLQVRFLWFTNRNTWFPSPETVIGCVSAIGFWYYGVVVFWLFPEAVWLFWDVAILLDCCGCSTAVWLFYSSVSVAVESGVLFSSASAWESASSASEDSISDDRVSREERDSTSLSVVSDCWEQSVTAAIAAMDNNRIIFS